jgi:hypothetical protein
MPGKPLVEVCAPYPHNFGSHANKRQSARHSERSNRARLNVADVSGGGFIGEKFGGGFLSVACQ